METRCFCESVSFYLTKIFWGKWFLFENSEFKILRDWWFCRKAHASPVCKKERERESERGIWFPMFMAMEMADHNVNIAAEKSHHAKCFEQMQKVEIGCCSCSLAHANAHTCISLPRCHLSSQSFPPFEPPSSHQSRRIGAKTAILSRKKKIGGMF